MKKFIYIIGLIFIGCNSNAQNNMIQKEFASIFIKYFANYKMDIQAAGIARIPAATFDNNELMIEYGYFSEGENRKGKMTLTLNVHANRFEGNWQTNADNGNIYKGSLFFIFNEKGEANGKYKFGGSNYKITIFKASK